MAARAAKLAAGAAGAAAQAGAPSPSPARTAPRASPRTRRWWLDPARRRAVERGAGGVSAPLKPRWQYATTAWGTGAGAVRFDRRAARCVRARVLALGMTAKKIIGTTVMAVTWRHHRGFVRVYTQNNVTDIPAAFAIGAVGACATPIGQRMARNVSGKTLRRWCGGALLACAPTAFMKKKKRRRSRDGTTVDDDHAPPGGTAEVRPGGAAALALAGKADELVARGGSWST